MVKTGISPQTKDEEIKNLTETVARLTKELHEYIKAEEVMIAAGIVTKQKVEQAHDIVRNW